MTREHKLGYEAEDTISGVKGVVTAHYFMWYNSPRVGIQPKATKDKPNEVPDVQEIDEHVMKFGKKSDLKVPQFAAEIYEFGDECTDSVTGYKGQVAAICYYISGCVHVCLTPKHTDKKEKFQAGVWFAQERLDLVKPKKKRKVQSFAGIGGPRESSAKEKAI
jgi:hypothetical protein